MSEVLNRILEYTLGTPGTYIDTPEFKADSKAAADRAIERIAENRNNRGGGPTKKVKGKTVPDLGIAERVVTGNLFGGNPEATREIQRQVEGLQETSRTEDYIKNNSDDYPFLRDYDSAGGMKGAKDMVQREEDLVAGGEFLTDQRTSIPRLNAFLDENSHLSPLEVGKRYTKAELAPYVQNAIEVAERRKLEPQLALQRRGMTIQETNATNNAISMRNNQAIEKARIARDEIIRKNELEYRQYEAAENRKMQQGRDDMTMRLAILDRTDRKEDREMRREDRKEDERQTAIMTLIQGLARLGQGFQL